MSSDKINNIEKAQVRPKPVDMRLAKFLSNLKRLSKKNDRELGEMIGASPQNFQQWRTGKSRPPKTTIKLIAKTWKVSEEELYAGVVNEAAADYGPKLTPSQREALANFDALIKSGDPEIVNHLERQINLLWDLYQTRSARKTTTKP